MIHLKFDLNQIKISKSFDFSKKNECMKEKDKEVIAKVYFISSLKSKLIRKSLPKNNYKII